ncbi:hypothetical protein R1sor_008561 [Riccia sorocarpa]|uniref:Complex 1 LYR protein domain-containing protein n=1 Tax=Riccia sorocarpa TaxID=122646 RepID=A0ABD3HXT4_9MARC
MANMKNAIPPHIAQSARNLYRECLRRADYIGAKKGNRETLRKLVREQFKTNMHETDPAKIQEYKDAAVRGLFNHMFYEASTMSDPLSRWTGIQD